MLRRRWRWASGNGEADAEGFGRDQWLRPILQPMAPEDVDRLAVCSVPLFAVPLNALMMVEPPFLERDLPVKAGVAGELALELFVACNARLDALRVNPVQGAIAYGLSKEQVTWLSRQSVYELLAVSSAAIAAVSIGVTHTWFAQTIANELDPHQKAQLAMLNRIH